VGEGSPLPAAPSAWAPPGTRASVDPAATGAATAPDRPDPPAEAVGVEAVSAEPPRPGSRFGRVAATLVAAAMVGGGAFLAFGAGTAQDGADSPEEAFRQAVAAVEAGDLVALAAVMEPGERDTVFDAGFSFLDEMARLGVLADDFDAAALEGFAVSLSDVRLTVERPRDDLARIHLDGAELAVAVDVAALPLGRRVLDRLDDEQRAFAERRVEVVDGFDQPVVAVRRDGRWFLSLWYTAAENIRLALGAPLPAPGTAPAPIGADTPEGAARRFLEEAVRLDPARMIGMFDPVEAAALYDYSPLFLDDASVAANDFLEAAEGEGWSWGFEELEFRAEVDDELATVFLDRMRFVASGESGSLSLVVGPDRVGVDVTTIDEFWGEETSWAIDVADGCVRGAVTSGSGIESFDSCEGGEGLPALTGFDWQDSGVVARRVDGRWYLSPVRTGLAALVRALEAVEGDDLDEVVGQLLGLPGVVLDGTDPFSALDGDDAPGAVVEAELVNGDLLAPALDPVFAYDLDAAQASWELGFFSPGLEEVVVDRGAYATVEVVGGEVALVVAEVASPDDALATLLQMAVDRDAVQLVASVPSGTRFGLVDDFGDPVLVEFDGTIITLVGVYGASRDAAAQVLDTQTAG